MRKLAHEREGSESTTYPTVLVFWWQRRARRAAGGLKEIDGLASYFGAQKQQFVWLVARGFVGSFLKRVKKPTRSLSSETNATSMSIMFDLCIFCSRYMFAFPATQLAPTFNSDPVMPKANTDAGW